MALRLNPATGKMEDDGTGTAINAASLFPAKPEHESTDIIETRAPSAGAQEADRKALIGEGDALDAVEQDKGVATSEAAAKETQAGDQAAELERLKADAAAAEVERQRVVAQHQREDHAEIDDVAAKRIAAGHAKADYWKGNAPGEFLASVLRGIDRAASSFRGEQGPTGTDRILDGKIAAHEQALVSEYEASKEAHELREKDRGAYEAELDRRRIQANNQSLLELKLIDARTDKALAALGPERAAAAAADKKAVIETTRADIQRKNAELYDRVSKHSSTDRSPTSTGGAGAANRPLSSETTDVVSAAAEYQRLAARQKELIAANGGAFPTIGPDASEFDKNERAMASAQQKQFGKSDNDAKLAAGIQGSPTEVMGVPVGKALSHIEGTNTVANYLRGLDTNADRLAKNAETRSNLETSGRAQAPAAAAAALGKAPAASAPSASRLAGASVQQLAAGLAAANRDGNQAAVQAFTRELASRKKK